MNIVSNHNRLLRGAAIPTAGGDMWTSGLEYTQNGEISGYSGSAFYQQECPCDSAAIVDSAFNKSTAWVDEQNYLTEHQDVSNLPYVQNSALGYNGNLISSISGDGFFAESANNSYHADDADHATYADSATHADSADFVATANFANSASSALNAEVANVAYTALTANFLDGGWELDVDGFITAYNNSAFAGNGGGGMEYTGISPIVVNNEKHLISAESARLGVQNPLYFVEDSVSATVIGIYDSAFPTFEGTEDGKISAINGSAINAASVTEYSAGNNIDITNHVISVTGSVPSADKASTAIYTNSANSATYDGNGNNIANTYLKVTSYREYTAGPNIDITNHVISGRDWEGYIRNIVQSGDATAYNAATAWVYNQGYLTGDYIPVSAMGIDTPMPGMLTYITGFSGSGISARVAAESFTALKDSDGRNLTALLANSAINSADGYVTGINGTPISGVGGQGVEYEGILPIVVNNVEHKISAQSARLGVQEPLYLVEDSETATVIGISGLPEVEGVMYESALNFGDGYITGYNSSALSSERSRYAVSSTSANGAVSSQTATIVTGGWETANGKITGYNGTAFSAGSTYDVKAGSNINVATAGTTFTVSGKDWQNTITAASSYAYNQATAKDKTYNVTAGEYSNIVVTTAGNTFGLSGKDWLSTIVNYTSYAYNQATANATGKYIPYANISTGDSGTQVYNVNKGIRVTAASGWTEIYCQNKENDNEAHLQVGQNYSDGKSFWSELDGAGGGFIQLNWNSGTIAPNAHSSYSDETTATLNIGKSYIHYYEGEQVDGNLPPVWTIDRDQIKFYNYNNYGSSANYSREGFEICPNAGAMYKAFYEVNTHKFRIVGGYGTNMSGVVDVTPGYINFYDPNYNLNAYYAKDGFHINQNDHSYFETNHDDNTNYTCFRIRGDMGNTTGTLDLTPGFIQFYDANWNVAAFLGPNEINQLKALLNHVQSASASWVNPSTATGSI